MTTFAVPHVCAWVSMCCGEPGPGDTEPTICQKCRNNTTWTCIWCEKPMEEGAQ